MLFWSSGILTGSQTNASENVYIQLFWSSGILTGSQTGVRASSMSTQFWSSGILTGSQTTRFVMNTIRGFGAVAF